MASDPNWNSVADLLEKGKVPSIIEAPLNEDGDPGSRRPSTTSRIVNSKTNESFTFHKSNDTFRSFVDFTSNNDNLIRGDLDYSKKKVDKTIGSAPPKPTGLLDHTIAFGFPQHAHDKLSALADERGERIATTARKIIEYKIANDPVIIRNAKNIQIAIKVSEQLRDDIDSLLEGTGMKRTDFLARQLHTFFDEVSPEPPEA